MFIPAAIISKSWFHSKNPSPAYAIVIFNSPNFSFSCSSCLALNKFHSTNHTTTPPITISYSPSTLTAKSIHNTCAKVPPNLTSDIYTSTTTINIHPKHQPNANTPRNIPKLMDLKFSSYHTPTPILSSSTCSKSSSIRSIDNSLTLVLEHLLPSVNYNFIVSLIDYINFPILILLLPHTSTATVSLIFLLVIYVSPPF